MRKITKTAKTARMKTSSPKSPPDGILLRRGVMLPIETYSVKRIREFDAAEQELARALSKKSRRAR